MGGREISLETLADLCSIFKVGSRKISLETLADLCKVGGREIRWRHSLTSAAYSRWVVGKFPVASFPGAQFPGSPITECLGTRLNSLETLLFKVVVGLDL